MERKYIKMENGLYKLYKVFPNGSMIPVEPTKSYVSEWFLKEFENQKDNSLLNRVVAEIKRPVLLLPEKCN